MIHVCCYIYLQLTIQLNCLNISYSDPMGLWVQVLGCRLSIRKSSPNQLYFLCFRTPANFQQFWVVKKEKRDQKSILAPNNAFSW